MGKGWDIFKKMVSDTLSDTQKGISNADVTRQKIQSGAMSDSDLRHLLHWGNVLEQGMAKKELINRGYSPDDL